MTQADEPADGKGEVRPTAGKNQKLKDEIADEMDAALVSDGPAEAQAEKKNLRTPPESDPSKENRKVPAGSGTSLSPEDFDDMRPLKRTMTKGLVAILGTDKS
jgi:hypothetical protein